MYRLIEINCQDANQDIIHRVYLPVCTISHGNRVFWKIDNCGTKTVDAAIVPVTKPVVKGILNIPFPILPGWFSF
jgi:hypothetical protein